MLNADYKAFIVEGEVREPQIIDNISKVFFTHKNYKIITLPAGQNIYMLWKKLKEDDFDTDIIEVLREEHIELEKQLEGLNRDNFSEVYLFFDYDGHQNNLGNDIDENVIEQMLISFNNETENGKLYINYPMVEALRDFRTGICGSKENCFVLSEELGKYTFLSIRNVDFPQFKMYDFQVWQAVIEVFSMRLSCLMNQSAVITYNQYVEIVTPLEIFKLEEKEILKNRVFIISAFPEFLLDYFGVKLWKKCVKHTENLLTKQMCRAE